jgi:5-dehydro-2-deoxygluconokinase
MGAIPVHYVEDGPPDVPVLVLANSLGTTLRMWDPQVAALGDRFRIVRYDHRGHGGSPVPPGPYTVDDIGADLLALLDRLDVRRADLCGLSLGGMAAMWLAAQAPQRVGRLALLSTSAALGPPCRPDYAKVLVRDNPEFDREPREQQFAALRRVSRALRKLDIPLLYELLVPATDDQLARVNGDTGRYDREVRPELVVAVIADNQAAGVEPSIWKIEGLETPDAARAVVAQARAGGRDNVNAIVLGRDAPAEDLYHWIAVAAPIDGFVGFAIGRSIWEDAVRARHTGQLDDETTSREVRDHYLDFALYYLTAIGATGQWLTENSYRSE